MFRDAWPYKGGYLEIADDVIPFVGLVAERPWTDSSGFGEDPVKATEEWLNKSYPGHFIERGIPYVVFTPQEAALDGPGRGHNYGLVMNRQGEMPGPQWVRFVPKDTPPCVYPAWCSTNPPPE